MCTITDDFCARAQSKQHERNHLSYVHLARRLRRRTGPKPRAPSRPWRYGAASLASRRAAARRRRPRTRPAAAPARPRLRPPRGAYVMGRNLFGPFRGRWQGDWRGWWGDEPPYHAPVFVLTHYEHEPIELAGGATFYFVGDGFDAAFARASDAAGDRGVDIAGGASTVRQGLAAGVIDELFLDFAPVLLGSGGGLFDGIADLRLEQVEVIHSPLATHVRYRVGR